MTARTTTKAIRVDVSIAARLPVKIQGGRMSLIGWVILLVILVMIFGNHNYGIRNTAWRGGPYYNGSYALLVLLAVVLIFLFGVPHRMMN